MRLYNLRVILLAAIIISTATILAFSQENPTPPPAQDQTQSASPVKEETSHPKEISIYGEVQAVNAAASSMTVQYYDYDSDEERAVEIVTDAASKIENAAMLNDIKQGDWVDVTYLVKDSKNIAQSIVVEKEEALAEDTSLQKTEPPVKTQE